MFCVDAAHRPCYIIDMPREPSPLSNPEHQVLEFRRKQRTTPGRTSPPVPDLTKFQQTEGTDDYRHRMIVNALAFIFVAVLIGAGLWLADTMASMRKNQDCVLSGRPGCTPVEFDRRRW